MLLKYFGFSLCSISHFKLFLSNSFQIHLVCKVPPYEDVDIKEPVTVSIKVVSSNRHSEPQAFVYTPQSSQLWPGVSSTIKTEHMPPPCLMPPHMYPGVKPMESALSTAQNLDVIVNSAADSHILPGDSSAPQLIPQVSSLLHESSAQQEQLVSQVRSLLNDPSKQQDQQQLVSEVSSLINESSSQQQQLVSQVRSLLDDPATQEEQQQLATQVSTLLNEPCTQEQIQNMITKSVAETAVQHNIITRIITTEAANSLMVESGAPADQLLLQEMIKSEQELPFPPTSTGQQQEIMGHLNMQLHTNPQQILQNMSDATNSQLMQNMNDANSQQLLQNMSESSPQQIMQSLRESSPEQILQNMTEANSQQMMQSIGESSPQQIMQSLRESSPDQLLQNMNSASSQQMMQSISESTPQQMLQNINDASPQHLIQNMNESSPQQIMQSLRESTPEQLMQNLNDTNSQLMQNLSESSPQQLLQNVNDENSQLMQSLSEATSPQQLMQSMGESSPQQLMQSMESSPQQIFQNINDSSPQQILQNMGESSPQQLMQSMTDSSQVFQSMSDNYPQGNGSHCSEGSSSPQLPYSQDTNAPPPPLPIAQDETSQQLQEERLHFIPQDSNLLQQMIQKSEDLKIQQTELLMSTAQIMATPSVSNSEAKLSSDLLSYMTPISAPDLSRPADKGDLKLQFSESKNLMLPQTSEAPGIPFSEASLPCASAPVLPGLTSPAAQQMLGIIVVPMPAAPNDQTALATRDIPNEVTQMSENDLLRFINPDTFNNRKLTVGNWFLM